MMTPETYPDPVDKLLNKIIRQVEKESAPVVYAAFLQRVVARLIDTAIIVGVCYGIELIAFHFIRQGKIYNSDYVIDSFRPMIEFGLPIMLWSLFYSPLMESTGGTIGKRVMRIKLVDEETLDIPPYRNFATRSWVYLVFMVLAVVPSILSCLAYFVSDKKQTWHDKLAGVICIKK